MKTKFYVLFIHSLIVLTLAACQSAVTPVQADDTEQNMAVVRRFYEEFSNGNADVILEVHSPTILMHYAGSAEEVPAQALRDDLAAIKATNPDLRAEVKDMFAQGDLVVTELTWTGTHTGDIFGIPATGKTFVHNGIVVRRLENGKIVESWEMWDDLAFLHSLELIPSWDEAVADAVVPVTENPTAAPTSALAANVTWSTKDQPEPLNYPSGLGLDAQGNLYVVDTLNHRIVVYDSQGQFLMKWGELGSGPGQFNFIWGDAEHNQPVGGVAVDSEGNIYVTDGGNARIQKFDSSGRFLLQWGSTGTGEGQFMRPADVAVDSQGHVFVVDDRNKKFAVHKFDSHGRFLAQWGQRGSGPGQFLDPGYIAVDGAGSVYVSDYRGARVQEFDGEGQFLAEWGVPFTAQAALQGETEALFIYPIGITVDKQGNIYVVDAGRYNVQKFDPEGKFLVQWGEQGSEVGQFLDPVDVAVDAQGNIYVSDAGGHRVLKFGQTGP